MEITNKLYPVNIGDTVYYSLDNSDGETIIYKGIVKEISTVPLDLNNDKISLTFYQLDTGIGVQRNACYTLQELFDLASRIDYLYNHLSGHSTIDEQNRALDDAFKEERFEDWSSDIHE